MFGSFSTSCPSTLFSATHRLPSDVRYCDDRFIFHLLHALLRIQGLAGLFLDQHPNYYFHCDDAHVRLCVFLDFSRLFYRQYPEPHRLLYAVFHSYRHDLPEHQLWAGCANPVFLAQFPFVLISLIGVILLPVNTYNRNKRDKLEGSLSMQQADFRARQAGGAAANRPRPA